jgi:hypothetical protein
MRRDEAMRAAARGGVLPVSARSLAELASHARIFRRMARASAADGDRSMALAFNVCALTVEEWIAALEQKCICGEPWAVHADASPHGCTVCGRCKTFMAAEPLYATMKGPRP